MENEKNLSGFCDFNFKAMSGNEVVISGISGVFPSSDSVKEFGENLFNKVDMVSEEPRWSSNDPEVPKHLGKISDIDKFDTQFFKIGYQQAKVLEPISRKILEHAYGAIFDSGNTHATLRGMKIGVFIGVSFVDFGIQCLYDVKHHSDFVVGGSSKSMLANRISYWADGRGPSYTLDYSCASSAAALEKAYNSIRNGDCDAAVVGSGNICSHPMLSLNLRKAGLLCLDGKTKCFDKNADGSVRAEAVSLLFLQKSKDAKRIYAEIYHAKGVYELKPDAQFLPVRKSDDIQKFLADFYSETDIEPEDVEYVEANGAAIATADENELDAIGKVFASDDIVKIGCVKSNMGHSEAVSGLAAVTKMCLAYHKGEIPANLHYKDPLEISAVQEGKVQVITERTKFGRSFAALNNFSYTGANYHVVLKGHYKQKNLEKYKCQVPRIVLASGREESCVNKIFESLKSKHIDAEEIALLHSIFEKDITGHTGRGYTILDTSDQSKTASISESIDYYSGVRRPLWFVYSGMGSQWAGMGADLMRIPTFKKAIDRCHKALEPKGVDIVKIISEPDKTIFDNILNAFMGIGAVQIGLTDILKEMGVEPDYIIGHSLGEMACAYHDNTLTTEELILATYSRGKAVLDSPLIKGSMAAVGVGYKALVNQCPPEIDIGCHNSSESSTISGPVDIMKKFVTELTERGIFAREVPSANIAYHSRYVADAGPALLRSLRDVIKNPKPRSKKWLSTSVPKEHWDDQMAEYSSPEYHTNNLLSPVLFEEVISMIPSNAVVVEIAPHGLLQAILKRSHPECIHVPLTRRGCPDSVNFLLDSIGKLYQAGYNPKVNVLYPEVEFPVSTETPLLSHLVEWEHSETWPIVENESGDRITSLSRDFVISMNDDDYSYIADHIVNGVTTIPEAALLLYVWETLAMYKQVEYLNLSVVFKDIQFHSEVVMKPETIVKLSVVISKGNDKFEINQDGTLIVSGIVSGVKTLKFQQTIDSPQDDFDDVRLNSQDIYKILSMRGFSYKGVLKSIQSINIHRNNALVKWTNEWVPFLDSLIQLNTLMRNYNGISKPKYIRKIKICVFEQMNSKHYPFNGVECHTVQSDETLGITRCAGVEINNITYIDKLTVYKEPDVLLDRTFYPHFATEEIDIKTTLQVNLQIIAENANSLEINVINLVTNDKSNIIRNIQETANWLAGVDLNLRIIHLYNNKNIEMSLNADAPNVWVLEKILRNSEKLNKLQSLITKNDFILTLEEEIPSKKSEVSKHFSVLTCMSDGKQILILMKKLNPKSASYFPITMENTFLWIPRINGEVMTTKKVVLISQNKSWSGLQGYVRKMKRDGHQNISLLEIHDFHAQPFNSNKEFYKDQLEKNLTINILKKGQWGGYYYTSKQKSTKLRSFVLKNNLPGDPDTLTWVEALPCSAKKSIVQVCYSGLSLNDCLKASNDFKNDSELFGMDFSGIDKNGDKVMGIISGGATSSTVEADPDLLWPVPDHWSLEDAATVPLPYVHAYYCLVVKKQLKKGQRVLVTGGAGALGQAVISLCLSLDCTVFTTVSEIEKKKTLLKLFPQLNEYNISYSDHDCLYNMVMTRTQNLGCHLVISCVTGFLRMVAMKCVGFMGVFLDLSKHDILENNNIGMSYLEKDRTYSAVNLSNIFRSEYANNKKILQHCISEGIAKGIVIPLTRVVYPPTMASKAFKLLSMRRHRGRVLLRLRDPVIMNQGLDVLPRLTYTSQDVIIIVCDEKGLGVELANRLVERGIKKIILHMKPGVISGYVHTKFISWSKHEVSVKLSSENLHIEQGCASLMRDAMKFGKVKGVFIVQDGKKDGNGDKDDFIIAYNKKCSVVLNVDSASRNCPDLSHFTIVSHLTQNASDEYALSLSERVCERRNESGLPALVMRYESLVEFNDLWSSSEKVAPQTLSTFLNSLETSLKMKYKNVLTFNFRENNSEFHKKIALILGVGDVRDIENETLQNLRLNEISLKEVRAAIKSTYQIDYPLQEIKRMTIQSLKELSKNEYQKNTDFNSGMAAFYQDVVIEEDYISQQPVAVLPTLSNQGDEKTIDPHSTYLIMIPGFDGQCEILKAAAERLKIKAVGIQLGPDIEGNSIREITEYVYKLIKTRLEIKSKFYILGYSFGVNIALELAAMIEENGQTGVVYCLDSSPEALRVHLDAYIGKLSEETLQDSVLQHMYQLMTGEKNDNLKMDLEKLASFETKVVCTLEKLKEELSYSTQYKRHVLESAYKRIQLAKEYKPEIKLESELVLMKGHTHPKADNLAEDYHLSEYTKKPIKIFNLNSDHSYAHQDSRVCNIVNKFLDKKVLDDFRKTSLCNVYFTDPRT